MPTYTADQVAASRSDGACGVRTWPTRSTASIARITATVRAHTQNGTSMRQQPPVSGMRQEPEVSPIAVGRRPVEPEVTGPRDDDSAASGILPSTCERLVLRTGHPRDTLGRL